MTDVAMYQTKAAGRNTVRFFDPVLQALALARTALEKDLRRGLAQQEFVLHYQIQVNHQGLPTGAEALLRWQHPVRGMVPPAQFIPLADEPGLILRWANGLWRAPAGNWWPGPTSGQPGLGPWPSTWARCSFPSPTL